MKGKLALFVHEDSENTIIIETPKEPILETKPDSLEGIEYKELLSKAKETGFEVGRGRPSKEDLIEFLRGQDE